MRKREGVRGMGDEVENRKVDSWRWKARDMFVGDESLDESE